MGKRKNKKSTIMPLSNRKITLLSGHLGSYPQFKYRMMNLIIEELYNECVKLDEEETKALNDRFMMVLEKFIEKMKDVDSTFKEIFNRIHPIGSFFDRLRIVEATEFDVNLVLKPNFMVEPIKRGRPPGFTPIKVLDVWNIKAPYKNWMLRTWCTPMGDFLNPNAVRSWLQGVVTKTLNEIEEEGKLFHGFKLKYHQSGPAATLSVTSQEAPSKKIDIDLVPVLEFSTSKRGFYPSLKKGDIRKIGDNEPWFAVPKPPSTNCDLSCHMCLSWRMSFPIQESAIINDLNLFKYTLRMVKKVRDELGIHEVASYYIKTLFLLELNKNGPAMFSECDRGFLFMYFLGCLRTALENGKIPFLWNQNFNLLGNVSERTLTNSAGQLKNFCDKIDKLVEEENEVQLKGVIQSLLNCPQN